MLQLKKILKEELIRSFNKFFLISLLISSIIVLWYSFERIPFCINKNNNFASNFIYDDFLEISFTNWICSHNLYLQQNIFYFILPILAVIPFGGSLYSDMDQGYGRSICIRVSKRKYLIAKYSSVFISGGCSVLFPMILSFAISSAFLPSMLPESSYIYTNIYSAYKFAFIFFTHPYLYIMIYMLIVFVFSGLIATTALTISFFSSKSFLPIIFPFFFYVVISLSAELLDNQRFSLMTILTTTDAAGDFFTVCLDAILLFLLTFPFYYFYGAKNDVIL